MTKSAILIVTQTGDRFRGIWHDFTDEQARECLAAIEAKIAEPASFVTLEVEEGHLHVVPVRSIVSMSLLKCSVTDDEPKPYLVGEQGPDLFVPNVAGTIVPNSETRREEDDE